MQKALESLPWVEKGSAKADIKDQTATFTVSDPKQFDLEEIKKAIPSRFKASLVKTGSALPAQ